MDTLDAVVDFGLELNIVALVVSRIPEARTRSVNREESNASMRD